ncbi:MAG: TonB family protein [Candidatus Eisenbacteria bacterium]
MLLLDEDTSATNFMIRDEPMRRRLRPGQEPIKPFLDRVRNLFHDRGVSSILVVGGSGEYFRVADRVVQMNHYGQRRERSGVVQRRFARLARRDRLFRRSLILSGILHFVLLLVLTFLPVWPRRTIVTADAPFVVSLRAVSEPLPGPVAPPVRQRPPEETRPPERRRLEQTDMVKTTDRASPAQTRATEKPQERPAPEPEREAPADTLSPIAATGPLELASVDDEQFTYDYYLQSVIGLVSEAWSPPAGLSGETVAMIRFRIMAQGQVHQAEIETPSGVPLFDRTARDAVMRAQPFPPFPPAYRGRWITLHLRFIYGR